MKRYSRLLVLGADLLDGGHVLGHSMTTLDEINLANQQGLRATIIGSSFRQDMDQSIITRWARLGESTSILVRDSDSFNRIERLAIPGVRLVADSAFCARARETPDSCRRFRAGMPEGSKTLGLNLDLHGFKQFGEVDECIRVVRDAIESWMEECEDLHSVLVPHDYRSKRNDETLLRHLYVQPPEHLRSRTFLPMRN